MGGRGERRVTKKRWICSGSWHTTVEESVQWSFSCKTRRSTQIEPCDQMSLQAAAIDTCTGISTLPNHCHLCSRRPIAQVGGTCVSATVLHLQVSRTLPLIKEEYSTWGQQHAAFWKRGQVSLVPSPVFKYSFPFIHAALFIPWPLMPGLAIHLETDSSDNFPSISLGAPDTRSGDHNDAPYDGSSHDCMLFLWAYLSIW